MVEAVESSLREQPQLPASARVVEVRLRVGALASVVRESLEFCYDLATEGTRLAGSKLVVEVQPVVVFCAPCGVESKLDGVQSLRCPRCGQATGDLRAGRELEIACYEIDDGRA